MGPELSPTTPAPGPVSLRIQRLVQENPGIHFRGLGRAAGLHSTGQLRHHIDRLVRKGLMTEVGDGRYRRYFPAHYAIDLQPHLARLSRPLPRRIVRLLLDEPMGRTAMRRHLDCADSTLGYHLARMLRQGDLVQARERRGATYLVADPERIRRILLVQDARTEVVQLQPAATLAPADALPSFGLAEAEPATAMALGMPPGMVPAATGG